MALQQVALFRGINVGRAKRVAMADLRRVLERLELQDVTTILASGNVVFAIPRPRRPAPLAASIRRGVLEATGIDAAVTVIDAATWRAMVAGNPLVASATDPSRLLMFVPQDRGRLDDLSALAGQDWGAEALAVGDLAAYVWCPDGVLASRAAAAVDRVLSGDSTARNWATVAKISRVLDDP
ncbi:MAG: DUF1697 domain-containing protein [Candidatus Krumholzibacteriia bacterium]